MNNITIDEKPCQNILIDYIVTIKKDLKIFSVNPLYLIFNKMNGYFEEINGNKYLTLVPTNESKDKIKKVWKSLDYNKYHPKVFLDECLYEL